ncbi:MAG: DUF72 domain-containing protein [Deltaproteobacteria bacterium]|nr:DUF72 domain-containing protein [Deltaproteobacteria bacterium]MCL4873062.1 DUF72 domain-containing protein [bacterium]
MEEKGVYIATSGWQYGHWIGPFYPEHIAKSKLFEFYATRFNTVEVNNSFYRLPEKTTFARWKEKSPEKFIFALKASRFITHVKRLKDPVEPVRNFMDRAVALGEKLGPILFQLPPRWNLNIERLAIFLEALPRNFRFAFECRDPSWFHPEVYGLLKEHNSAFCIFDFDFLLSPREVTADFIYIRLHGPAGKYRGQYSEETLRDWAGFIRKWKGKTKAVYCYFDNDEAGYAAADAQRLKNILRLE